MIRRLQVGWVGPVGATVALCTLGCFGALVARNQLNAGGTSAGAAILVRALLTLTLGMLAATLVLACATFTRALGVAPRTHARGRWLWFAISSISWVVLVGVTWVAQALLVAKHGPLFAAGLAAVRDPGEFFYAYTTLGAYGYAALVANIAFSLATLSLLQAGFACWFLIAIPIRVWLWRIFDTLLAAALAFALVRLPPAVTPGLPGGAALPAVRLAITSLAVLRAFFRVLPHLLDAVERAGFSALVAARQLRAKKSGFLTAIGVLAIMAVTFSSCALATTLSVMGGFRDDLKQKILGNNAHVGVDRDRGSIANWRPALAAVRATPGVRSAGAYVGGEVMLTSATNLAGALLRGIDVDAQGGSDDLARALKTGRVDYLRRPEELLRIPESERSFLGFPPSFDPSWRSADDDLTGLDPHLDPHLSPDGSGERRSILDVPDTHAKSPPRTPTEPTRDRALTDPPAREVFPGVILGQELASALRVRVGDDVNLVSPLGDLGPAGPMPKSRPFRVAGVFYTGMYEYDVKYIYTTLETAQRFLGTNDEVTAIDVKVERVEDAPAVASAIRTHLARGDLRVRDWQELNRNLFGALALEKLAMFILLGTAILVAGFCVFCILLLMVEEKARDVAILKAMGTTSGSVASVFLLEGLIIGVFGAVLGLGLGFVACFAAEHFGIAMNPEVYYIDRLPVHIDSIEFMLVGITAVVVCVASTVIPAYFAGTHPPVEALRNR